VLAGIDDGLPATTVAERLGVSLSFIYKALKRRRVSGETIARAQRNQQALKLAAQHAAILAEVERRPDVTLDELRAWLLETHGIEASLGLMHNTLIRLGLTLKESGRAEEQDRPDIAEQRTAWRAGQAALSRGRLIFIDETGASTKLARRYGRCRRGQRLDAALPYGHWKATTFVGGLTSRGFIAPYVLDGAMDGRTFRAWTEQMLAPNLAPGDVVSMDNLAAHKVHGVREAIEARGAELRYLPPYSPDLNPIENAFAKLKAFLRKAAELTIDGLWKTIGKLLDRFSPAECHNYIENAGYVRSA